MKTYIIYPTHRIRGYTAPGIAITTEKYEVAKSEAIKKSRLSDFPDIWIFI